MDWYAWARDGYDDRDGGLGATVGTIRLSKRLLIVVLALLTGLVANHLLRVTLGGTSWFAIQEVTVSKSPGWMPNSRLELVRQTRTAQEIYRLGLPMPAQIGQHVVVHYTLEGAARPQLGGGVPLATIHVRCGIGCRTWQTHRIFEGGTGEFVVTVNDPDFYTFDVIQQTGGDGGRSHGTYWLGVRSGA